MQLFSQKRRTLPLLFSTRISLGPCGEDWIELSKENCWIRDIKRNIVEERPKNGCYCQVEWTAWLGVEREACFERGDRIGMVQPNSSLEFTLGGGSVESTKAWDAATATMGIGDAIEIFATPDWAFGEEAIEPHIPERAYIFFELRLINWTDWAQNFETIYGLNPQLDDDSKVLQNEIERLASLNETQETNLLDDLNLKEQPKFANFSNAPPIPVSGQNTKLNYTWTETATDITICIQSESHLSPTDIHLQLKSKYLELFFHNSLRLSGELAGFIFPSQSTWAITEDRLAIELFLTKRPTTGERPTMADIWASVFLPPSSSPHYSEQQTNS